MSKILSALEKAHKEGAGTLGLGAASDQFGIFALPTLTRTVPLRTSILRKTGWIMALPRPPKVARTFTALSDHLRGTVSAPARILVCGVETRAGATATSLNLASELANHAHNTAFWSEIPNGEARGFHLHLGPACQHGLLDHLYRDLPLREVLIRTQVPRLVLLPGRGQRTPKTPPPTGQGLAEFYASIHERYPDRYVVVDAPPPTESFITGELARQFDATVLVASAGVSETAVCNARDALGAVANCSVLFNRAPRRFLG